MSKYEELRKIDVTKHIEKKNGLSYLSWAWAVDTLLQYDQTATWEYREPKQFGETLMVFCTVNAFGKSMTAQLPVMDYRNKAIPNPDSFAVNTAMQRCLAKAIALHGLGLYIYAGEDLPEDDKNNQKIVSQPKFEKDRLLAIEIAVASAIEAFGEQRIDACHEFIYGLRDNEEILEAWSRLKDNAPLRREVKKYREQLAAQGKLTTVER
jgi:hypothetical protein